jgi:hypothetical protein
MRRATEKKTAIKKRRLRDYKHELTLLLGAAVLLLVGVILQAPWQSQAFDQGAFFDDTVPPLASKNLRQDLAKASQMLAALNNSETKSGISVVTDSVTAGRLVAIEKELKQQQFKKAHFDLAVLDTDIANWQKQLSIKVDQKKAVQPAQAANLATNYLQVPILIYHHPPADFENQLKALTNKGYTGIDLGQLVGALHHSGEYLPLMTDLPTS